MNIGFDAKRIFYNETGLGNYSRTLVRLLKKSYPFEHYYLFSPPMRGENPHKHRQEFSDCTIVEPEHFLDRIFPAYWRNYSVVKSLPKYNLDIYHGLSHEIPRGIEKTGIKSIVTIHDLIFLRYPEFYKSWDVAMYKRKYLASCFRADAIIAISENTKKDILEHLNIPAEKIHVVYQSASADYYQAIPEHETRRVRQKYLLPETYLLYVGSLNKRKNLAPLIEAIPRLKNKDLQLIIVGSGSEKKRLEQVVQNEGVSRQVRFLSGVPNEDLPSLYHGARVFIYPSLYEGFGIPIIESLLCKTPVILNHGSCFHEAAGEGGLYVDVSNSMKLAEAIDFLLDDQNNLEVARKGFDHVQKFSPENFVKHTYELYKQISVGR